MATVNSIVTALFNLGLDPLVSHAWVGLALVSALTGLVLLVIFRYTSNQRGIRTAKDRILAHLLEVVLYRDQMRVVVRAQSRLVIDNLRYLGHALVPLAFMILPVGLMLVQLDLRYGRRPLRVGETAVVSVKLRPGTDLDKVALNAPQGVKVETPSLRIPALNEVDWRVRATAAGDHKVTVSTGEDEVAKQVVVGDRAARVSTARVDSGVWAQFLHPGEPPVPASSSVQSIAVSYGYADLPLGRWRINWVWAWLIISMAFGYALKGPLRVQV